MNGLFAVVEVSWGESSDMKSTFYFVRHAEAQVNVDPLSNSSLDALTEQGQRQARLVAERFRTMPIDNIYTSKIFRARLTAQEIGAAVNKEPIILECLKERKVRYIDRATYMHEETFEQLRLRLFDAKNLLENLVEDRVVIVSHALFLRALMGCIIFGDLLTEELLERITQTCVVDHAAASKLEYNKEKKKWRIYYWNDCRHLAL